MEKGALPKGSNVSGHLLEGRVHQDFGWDFTHSTTVIMTFNYGNRTTTMATLGMSLLSAFSHKLNEYQRGIVNVPRNPAAAPLADERWSIVPLDHTLQTLMVREILQRNPHFCQNCILNDGAYPPTTEYELPATIRGSAQARAVYYIIETIIHKIARGIPIIHKIY